MKLSDSIYHITYYHNGNYLTWGYMTEKGFISSLQETNFGRSKKDLLTKEDFLFKEIFIRYE